MEFTLEEVQQHLDRYALLSIQKTDDPQQVLIEVRGNKKDWLLRIVFKQGFPYELPAVYLEEGISRLHQHICWKKQICISDSQGISTNFLNPPTIISNAIYNSIELLEQKYNPSEFWDEFEGYWCAYSKSHVKLFIDPNNYGNGVGIYKIFAYLNDDGEVVGFYDKATIFEQRSFGYRPYEEASPHLKSFLICLDKLSHPPTPSRHWSSGEILDSIKNGLTAKQLRTFEKKLTKTKQNDAVRFVFRIPRPTDGYNIFSCQVVFHARGGLFGPLSAKDTLIPYHCERAHKDFIYERGGAYSTLRKKSVAIIGCGSLGGNVAYMLAQSGVGKLTLVDPDTYKIENIYRHILPSSQLRHKQSKVQGLEKFLSSEFPHVEIAPFHETFENWFSEKRIGSIDCIVIAIGSPSLERKICADLHNIAKQISVVHCWQEGLSLGGHVMGYRNNSIGCFNCLFYKSGMPKLFPSVSFLSEGQSTSKSIGGCVGAFTPYSAVDSFQTSVTATRIVIEYLNGAIQGAFYDGWKSRAPMDEATNIDKTNLYDNYQLLKDKITSILNSTTCNVCKR